MIASQPEAVDGVHKSPHAGMIPSLDSFSEDPDPNPVSEHCLNCNVCFPADPAATSLAALKSYPNRASSSP
jgi:hypothetical protein